jgi:hypothetical protein
MDEMNRRASAGMPREYRVTNALVGKHSVKVLEDVAALLIASNDDPRWTAYLAELRRTDSSSLAVSKVLFRAGGVVFIRFELPRFRFPLNFLQVNYRRKSIAHLGKGS